MNQTKDYRLVNLRNRELKLRSMRRDILVSDSEKALDLILDAPAPASLIQSFPDQDLYYLMHKIGPDDFIPILALARSDQWEYILDVEVWNGDRLDLDDMTRNFDLLFRADPKRLLRWVIKEKPDFFEFYLFKNMEILIREHDEIPPDDEDGYITLDDKFYFRFPFKPQDTDEETAEPKDSPNAWELIEPMLKAVAEMDLSVFHGLLLETCSILTAETEEEQFRLKNLRLAEKGFLPTHEAVGIYQPVKPSQLRKRPPTFLSRPETFDPDMPLPPQFFTGFMEGEDLFAAALKLVGPELRVHLESEIAALINKVVSADKIKLKARQDLEKAVSKACDTLNLGLEVLVEGGPNPASARDVIETYFLEDIFRTGSRAGIKLKTRADKWFSTSFINENRLPLSFLGEDYLGVIGGLLLDRPLFFNNYAKGELYRNFTCIADINHTEQILEQVIALDEVLGNLDVDVTSFKEGILTYKTLILTLWAKNRLNLPSTLEPIDINKFKDFFTALFTPAPQDRDQDKRIQLNDLVYWTSEATGMPESVLTRFYGVLSNLIRELESEYGSVDPKNIDPRFIPHFLLKKTVQNKPKKNAKGK